MSIPAGSFFSSSSSSTNNQRSGLNESRRQGEQRSRRDMVVVSSTELAMVFDGIKQVTDCVKNQNNIIEKMAEDVESLVQEVSDLKNEVALVKESSKCANGAGSGQAAYKGPVPKELRDDVHMIHNGQNLTRKFRGQEGIDSSHNAAVRSFIVNEILKEENGYTKALVMKAVTRYFETKRQQYLDSLPDRQEATERKTKEKILTSRRRRLYLQRLKAANETEAEKLRAVDLNYMSDEDDGEGDRNGFWVVSSPSWRSQELNRLLSTLDERTTSKEKCSKHPKNPRVRGPPSSRPPPKNAPQWAVRIERREPEIVEEQDSEREREEQQPTVGSRRRERITSESSDDGTPRRCQRHLQLTTNRSLFPDDQDEVAPINNALRCTPQLAQESNTRMSSSPQRKKSRPNSKKSNKSRKRQ